MAERSHLRAVESPPRELPVDTELEDNVVGAAIAESDDVRADVLALLRSEMFASEARRQTFASVERLVASGRPVNPLTVAVELEAADRLQQVGGSAYVTRVALQRPILPKSHMLDHARRVLDAWVRRDVRYLAHEIVGHAEAKTPSTTELLERARTRIDDMAHALATGQAPTRLDAAVDRALGEVLDAVDKKPGSGVLATGFQTLDRVIVGLPRDLSVLGAPPGGGKTSLSCAIAVNVARTGAAVVIQSLETPREELSKRLLAAEAGIDAKRTLAGSLTASEVSRLVEASRAMRELPIYVDDSPGTVKDLWARCRSVQRALTQERRAVGLVIVDYLQLVTPATRREKRHEEVAAITRGLKSVAVQLRVPVLALSQLNDAGALAESSELLKCARLVLALKQTKAGAEITVRKDNNGTKGDVVRLAFDGPSLRYSDLPEHTTAHALGCQCIACREASLFPEGHQP